LNWLLVVGGERFIGNYLPALTVNVPCEHCARPTVRFIKPKVQWHTACTNVYLSRLSGRATFDIPVAQLVSTNIDHTTIVSSDPKLNRLMFWNRNKPSHLNHEQVVGAI
jgi:hypothetical protein